MRERDIAGQPPRERPGARSAAQVPELPLGGNNQAVARLKSATQVPALLLAGNHALARLLARQPVAELPKLADTLKHYRVGAPLLKALAPAPGGTDLAAATAWLRSLVEVLKALGDAADASNLTFESTVVTDHDPEYGAAGADVHEKIGAARWGAQALGERIRDHVVSAMNASSVIDHGRADNPALGTLEQAKAFREQASAFHAAAPTPELRQAAEACQDAALALLQALSVAEARETWRAGSVQTNTVPEVKDSKRARNEMDDVFADAGFSDRQSIKKVKTWVTQPDGTKKEVETEVVDDWCGMFAAANMFRGAALDKDLRKAFAHTDNVNDFFQYTANVNASRAPLSVFADGQWWSVKDYHAARGALRKWVVGPSAAADIRPGDIALIRHCGRQDGRRDRQPHRHGRVLRRGHGQARLDRGQRLRGRPAGRRRRGPADGRRPAQVELRVAHEHGRRSPQHERREGADPRGGRRRRLPGARPPHHLRDRPAVTRGLRGPRVRRAARRCRSSAACRRPRFARTRKRRRR